MLTFQKIRLEDMPRFAPYLDTQPYRSCDYTVGAIYQWRTYLNSQYAIADGMLILRADYPGESDTFAFPVGPGDVSAALDEIEAYAKQSGRSLTFCAVPEAGVELLTARYGARCKAENRRDWADYLYTLNDLIEFPGKKYHTQRNHLNRFRKEHADAALVSVTEETLPVATRFLEEYAQYAPIDKVIEQEEMKRSRELLRDALALGQKAAYLTTGGVVIALAIGETLADTLYVHVEKARVDYAGAYQAIVSMFADWARTPETQFINREDDSGEEGLRYSKMAYRPIGFVDKYWVTVAR